MLQAFEAPPTSTGIGTSWTSFKKSYGWSIDTQK